MDNGFIEIEKISKIFETSEEEQIIAINQVSFDIKEGEFIALLGPSGCGKSTLILIIAGLLKATSGTVHIRGKKVEKPQTDIGIVFQKPVLLDWRNTLGNVLVQIELRRENPKDYEVRARNLLDSVGLNEFEKCYPFELSGGMQQRASICRALVHNPPILLMDEPFGALDALTREQLRIDLEHVLMNERKTVIFVTHSISEAVQLADRVVVMGPRPSNIEKIIEIDIDRPRHRAIQKSERFINYVNEITEIFMARGILHE